MEPSIHFVMQPHQNLWQCTEMKVIAYLRRKNIRSFFQT